MSFVFGDLFPEERSYRPGEVARRLGVHIDTIRRWTNDGTMQCIRLGGHRRIPYESLKTFTDDKLVAPHKTTVNLDKLP